MLNGLKANQPELKLTDREIFLVKTAGLCHDLGHGPFSHVFDSEFIPRVKPGVQWHHEMASIMMLEDLIHENKHDLSFTDEEIMFLYATLLSCRPSPLSPPLVQRH
jgi:deoxynucleoside triphosphate triphosphohydrolase SAMHD1